MKIIKTMPVLALAVAAILLSGTTTKAETISAVLTNTTDLTAVAGQTVAFDATVTDTDLTGSPTLYLVGDSFSGDGTLGWDDTQFYWDFIPSSGLYEMNPGDSFTTEMMDVMVPLRTAAGEYTETMVIQGTTDSKIYTDGATPDNLALLTLTVDVSNPPSTVTPEPSSLLLLATGLAGLVGAARRKLNA